MKWITHQTAGVGAALALHLPLEGGVAACLGAILPDKLDQAIAKRSRNPQRTFNQIHRGTTHWFGWWVAILLVACSHLVPPHWQPALLGIGLGGISHVVLDMLTPSGIPLHPFSRKNKLSFKVCSTGSVGEYVFLGVMLVLLGFLLGPEMKELIRHVRQLGMPVLHFWWIEGTRLFFPSSVRRMRNKKATSRAAATSSPSPARYPPASR